MHHRACLIASAAIVLLSAALAGADDGILINSAGNTNMPWVQTDSAGFRWDIQHNGTVGDGNNDAYDGGLQLQIMGSQFSGNGQTAVNKNGDEIQIGPWQRNNQVNVWRRIHVDKKNNYARWVDIFENISGQDLTLEVKYYTNLGSTIRQYQNAAGKSSREPTWAFITDDPNRRQTPAIVHIVGAPKAKVLPNIQANDNNDSIYLTYSLKIPKGEKVGLFLVQMQRSDFDQAVASMKKFKAHRELRNLPLELRKILVNNSTPMLEIAGLEVPRDDENDIVILSDDNDLVGTITNASYTIETFYGTLELPAERVVGMATVGMEDEHVRIALVDGQVLTGKLTSGPLQMTMRDGNELSLPIWQLRRAGYRISDARPKEIRPDRPVVVLRTGQQLCFDPGDFNGEFLTEYGTVRLEPETLRAVELDTVKGGLHRAMFINGSTLSGLLLADDLTTQLTLGPTVTAQRPSIRQIVFPVLPSEKDDVAVLTLRNQNVLRGAVLTDKIRLRTHRDELSIDPADIADLTRAEGALRTVTLKLHSGGKVTGDILNDTLRFAIQPGPQLDVFVGHINSLTCPKPPKPQPAPHVEATDGSTTQPAEGQDTTDEQTETNQPATPESQAQAAVLKVKVAKLHAEINQLQQVQAKLTQQINDLTAQQKKAATPAESQVIAQKIAASQARQKDVAAKIEVAKKALAELSK